MFLEDNQQTIFNNEEWQELIKEKSGWLPDDIPPINAVIPSDIPEWFKPRPVQKIMFKGHMQAYKDGCNSPLIMAMTSSGKTLYTAMLFHKMLTKNPNQRLLFTVPRIALVEQAMKEFNVLGLCPSVIWQKDPRFDPSAQIHIAVIDTMLRRVTSKSENTKEFFQKFHFDMHVVDEAHLMKKDLDLIPHTRRTGLSASPFTKGLAKQYDRLVKTLDTPELITDGTIKPYWPIVASSKIDDTRLKVGSNGEYIEAEEELAANELVGDVVSDLKHEERFQGRKWIAFCKTIKSAQYFNDEFNKNGIKTGIIHSGMSANERKDTIDASLNGLYDGLVSVIALREGYSDKKVNMVIWLTTFAPDKKDPTRPNNLNGWVQGNGRGGRANEGDADCIVADYGNNWLRYGSPYRFVDQLERLDDGEVKDKEEKKESQEKADNKSKPIECNKCHSLIEFGNKCSYCGNEVEIYSQYIEGEPVQFRKGRLVEANNHKGEVKNKKEYTQTEKQEFWQGLKFEAEKFGQSQIAKGKIWNDRKTYGYTIGKYKEFFNINPPNSREFKNAEPKENKLASSFIKEEKKKWIQKQRVKGYAKKKTII